MINLKNKILSLKKELNITISSHFYQKDEVFDIADIVGDSLELAKKSKEDNNDLLFCGVAFMGESVKILTPDKKVYMPKKACCAMARMIDEDKFKQSIDFLKDNNINLDNITAISYINSSAIIKAEVGKLDGYICTSSNAKDIIKKVLDNNKKVLFMPDRCLGINMANQLNKSSCIIGDGQDPQNKDIICFDGFCSVHQVFDIDDIKFYKDKYKDILIISHPECSPEIVDDSDFVGSTSQMIKYIEKLDKNQKIAVATEFNLVNRMRKENTYILSSTKPTCPTMNETTLQDVYDTLINIKNNNAYENEIILEDDIVFYAKKALNKMLELK
jgi:quinolinate synthase